MQNVWPVQLCGAKRLFKRLTRHLLSTQEPAGLLALGLALPQGLSQPMYARRRQQHRCLSWQQQTGAVCRCSLVGCMADGVLPAGGGVQCDSCLCWR